MIDSNGTIRTDLYKKKMSINQYLLPSSFHPKHITKNIPYNIALRIRRICSDKHSFEKRLSELKVMLMERKYKLNVVNDAFDKVRTLNRSELLKLKKKKSKLVCSKDQPLNFVFPYYSQLPDPNKIIKQYERELFRESECKKAYTEGFRATYTKGKNLENLLCRAKLWPIDKNPMPGWFPCKKCIACEHSIPRTDTLKFHYKQRIFGGVGRHTEI